MKFQRILDWETLYCPNKRWQYYGISGAAGFSLEFDRQNEIANGAPGINSEATFFLWMWSLWKRNQECVQFNEASREGGSSLYLEIP